MRLAATRRGSAASRVASARRLRDERGGSSERGRDDELFHPITSRQQHNTKLLFSVMKNFCGGTIWGFLFAPSGFLKRPG